MAKNIIIAGVPRSGKSTLAKRLCVARQFSYLPMDSLVSAFGRIFPETGITHYDENHERACRAFWPFFCELLRHLEYERFRFVADVYHLLPDDVASEGLTDRYHVVFLGYPSADCAAKCRRIRADARLGDWTGDLSEAQLADIVTRFIEESRALQAACRDLRVRFIDTSERFEKSLDAVYRELAGKP